MYRNNKNKKYILLLNLILVLTPPAIYSYGSYEVADIFPFFKDIPSQGDMVFIPAGEFIMGSSEEEVEKVAREFGKKGDFVDYDFRKETPKRKVYVKAFYIDRYEVTNAQYKRFIDATGHRPPYHWENGTYPQDKGSYPVINVSMNDAKAYTFWAGKRLPTEEEWEKASRGMDGRIYPWGNEFNPHNVRTAEAFLNTRLCLRDLTQFAAPVDEFKNDKSPYGVYDTAGNVMEWTDSWYEKGETKVVKGAAWVHLGPRARSAGKDGAKPDEISHIVGFRCAMDAVDGIKTSNLTIR
ncbi:MAG: SUMF1/EgtB/PvdO family nonheme iron enzyme [Deltaproteobacteria bacterium]|nr:SUMF1/EgtB/PvdO family nonheme iron enzyme [Deltaproteobacteria bacterium]